MHFESGGVRLRAGMPQHAACAYYACAAFRMPPAVPVVPWTVEFVKTERGALFSLSVNLLGGIPL